MHEARDQQGTTGDFVYHYTSAETALKYILPDGRILLSPVERTNDPWEMRPLEGAVANNVENLDDSRTLLTGLHAVVRRAQRACFGLDDPSGDKPSGCSLWGWARDRMWAQYAENHQGVCLWFVRQKLVDAFRSALSARGECLAEAVQYADDNNLPPLDGDAVARGTREQSFLDYRRSVVRARYFQKRLDWSAEREFRLLVLEEESNTKAAYVPITGGVLVGVTVGCRFRSEDEATLGRLSEAVRVPVSRIVYSDIARVEPYGPMSLDGLEKPWW